MCLCKALSLTSKENVNYSSGRSEKTTKNKISGQARECYVLTHCCQKISI